MSQQNYNVCACSTKAHLSHAPRHSTLVEALAISSSLIASNCCVIQLLMNALSLGCSGFAVLDCVKPYARALTIVAIFRLVFSSTGIFKNRRAAVFAVTSALLLFSQNALAIYNKGSYKNVQVVPAWLRTLAWQRLSKASTALEGDSQWESEASPSEQARSSTDRLRFHVQGIKCEGCAAHLKGVLQALEGVREVQVDFGLKEVSVQVDAGLLSEQAAALTHAIRGVDLTYDPVLLEGL